MSTPLEPAMSDRPPRLLSLRGRIDRVRYVAYAMFAIVGAFMLMLFAGMLLVLSGGLGQMLYMVFMVVLLYGALPLFFVILTIKRAHDFNSGGWIALLLVVPVVNLLFWFMPGSRMENAYGLPREAPPFGVKLAAFVLPVLLLAGFLAASDDIVVSEHPAASPSTTLQPYTP